MNLVLVQLVLLVGRLLGLLQTQGLTHQLIRLLLHCRQLQRQQLTHLQQQLTQLQQQLTHLQQQQQQQLTHLQQQLIRPPDYVSYLLDSCQLVLQSPVLLCLPVDLQLHLSQLGVALGDLIVQSQLHLWTGQDTHVTIEHWTHTSPQSTGHTRHHGAQDTHVTIEHRTHTSPQSTGHTRHHRAQDTHVTIEHRTHTSP